MKIISKFGDYYDSCQYMCGENITYIRNMNLRTQKKTGYGSHIIEESKEIPKINNIFSKYLFKSLSTVNYSCYNWKKNKINKDYKDCKEIIINNSIVIIGEMIVKFITICYINDYKNKKYEFYYDKQTFLKKLEDLEVFKWKKKYFEEHFNNNYNDLYNKIREITTEPIISYSIYEQIDSETSALIKMNKYTMINPILKDFKMSNIIPSNIVIQELELYINKLNNVEKKNSMDNELKIKQAGFDEKSFKK